MYATLSTGNNESHKNVDKSTSRILNMYYTNKSVLFTVCALNEVFFIALYLLSFSSPLLSPSLLQQVPGAQAINRGDEASSSVIKQLFTNPYSAGALELARANKMVSKPAPQCIACAASCLGYDSRANTQLD
jgi:CDP-diacylglycerol--inositol 3-phosphatidyltransferase